MSIDYDKLRADLDEIEAGVHVTTRYTWADLARELLRLRDGVKQFDAWLSLGVRTVTSPTAKNALLDARYVLAEQLLKEDTEPLND